MENQSLPINFTLSDEVLFQEIEGECVLLNMKNEQYYGLDEVGTRFWSILSDGKSPDFAFKQLLTEFEIDAVTLKNDLSEFIKNLNEQGLVTIKK